MDDKDHLWPYLATFQATKSSSKTALRYNEKKKSTKSEACSSLEDRDNILVHANTTYTGASGEDETAQTILQWSGLKGPLPRLPCLFLSGQYC